MSLLQMSFAGAVMILAIATLRAFSINKLPKKVFLILWEFVLLRLLVPFSIPSIFSAYSFINNNVPVQVQAVLADTPVLNYIIPQTTEVPPGISENVNQAMQNDVVQNTVIQSGAQNELVQSELVQSVLPDISIWFVIWLAGMLICAGFFVITYLRWRGEFLASLPMKNSFIDAWQKNHPLRRSVKIRQSGRILAPLTYGILQPIILMPKNTDWENREQLQYVFMHEYIHIRRFDTVRKLIATLALCVHWFNPLVWAMYTLYNRDIELVCDESVVREFGENSKSTYARALISMEETKSGLRPLCNNFSKSAIEERIRAIMKTKKMTLMLLVISVVVVAVMVVLFATSAKEEAAANGAAGEVQEAASSDIKTKGENTESAEASTEESEGEFRPEFIMIQFKDQIRETSADLHNFEGFSLYIPQTWSRYYEYLTPPAVLTLEGAGGEIWIERYEDETLSEAEARFQAEGYAYDEEDAKWRKAEGTLIKRVELAEKFDDVWAVFRVHDEAYIDSDEIDMIADTCIITGTQEDRPDKTKEELILVSDAYYYEPARCFYEMDWENVSTKISAEESETLQKYLPVLNGEKFTWIYRSDKGEEPDTYIHDKKEVTIREMLADQLDVHGLKEVEPLLDSFYFADVFQSGRQDMVLCLRNMAYEWLILHEEDGVIYGIDMSIRWFSEVYENGMYVGSGGADDHSYSRMKFVDGDYIIEDVARVYMGKLYIDGEEKTAAEYETWKEENLRGMAKRYNPLGEVE